MNASVRPVALLALLALAGCGDSGVPPRGQVAGKITVAGKGPLTGGALRFELLADPKVFGSGQVTAEGAYECLDAPVGECRVVVENQYLQVGGSMPGKLPGGGSMPGMPGMGGMTGAGAPGSGRPPADASKKMNSAPKGAEMPAEMGATAGSVGAKYLKIDAKYASPTESPVKFTVTRGKNAFDFEVK